ncbi:hypothetical protein Cob_v003437 [Colletotrichum orbiculare MAFF 240422]|uniref:Uncharacterized protein n=1 Tax=Colletotrichum orbiculare (strain 104-T / ATCC 96160 / CBS 514.97 / LARS 414 / MAFF 240422) TaxID=1213857 RepID=A0A484G196_COLOR|nr:hypothetical protein Cob_v003437 [Colletotrichum orbiculare MAFF 240422]
MLGICGWRSSHAGFLGAVSSAQAAGISSCCYTYSRQGRFGVNVSWCRKREHPSSGHWLESPSGFGGGSGIGGNWLLTKSIPSHLQKSAKRTHSSPDSLLPKKVAT